MIGLLAAIAGLGAFFAFQAVVDDDHDHSAHDHGDHDHVDAEPIRAPVDPCTLVTEAELEQIVGAIVEPTEQNGAGAIPGQRACLLRRSEQEVLAVIGLGAAADAGVEGSVLAGDAASAGGVPTDWNDQFRILGMRWGEWFVTVQMTTFEHPSDELRELAVRIAEQIGNRTPPPPPS